MATKTKTKTQEKTTATTEARKPSEQALQAVDVVIGAGPTVADNVRTTAETWTNSEKRSQEIDTLQKRVQTLREAEGRKSEIESLRKRLAAELEKAEGRRRPAPGHRPAHRPGSQGARAGRAGLP
jgi:molecular chaperone GrpE (heat shock protein)